MLKWFITPTGEKITVQEALDGALADYYPLSYLHMCAEEREWTGKPSTTQLINGTRMEYLRLLTDYSEDPRNQAFRIVGTRAHSKLEKFTPDDSIAEFNLPDEEISGIPDLLEKQPDGTWVLTDYKVWGSYKVGLALGLEKKKRPAFDWNGQPMLYKKSGKWGKAGEQKIETYYEQNPDLVNIPETELQINRYKIVIEQAYDIVVSKMRVFCVVRDGGTVIAKGRGVVDNTYYIPVKELDYDYVKNYFEVKRITLLEALDGYEKYEGDKKEALILNCPQVCNNQESWNGRRCQGYCPVAEICNEINRERSGGLW